VDAMSDLKKAAQQALEAMEDLLVWHSKNSRAITAITALKAALEQPNECLWLQDGDEDSGTYMASCNRRYFMFEDGTPTDNRMKHCCYCGKPLVEVPIEPEDEHD
jgi:hypothetical protein